MFGKCKICPVSCTLKIPHLELVVAALATRVATSMLQESNIKYDRVVYWSDSLATLHLIRNTTLHFGIFVSEIQSSSSVMDWHYCPTAQNPADVGTWIISSKN